MLFRSTLKIMATLFAFVAIGAAIFAPSASATNGHQDHQGACARSTTSVKTMVTDLKYNGVLGEFANAVGIHAFDGSLAKQMENQMVVGKIAKSVTTNNTGCDGSGGTFSAGKRTLYKGESVFVKVPAKYGKEACKHPNHRCKRIRVVVNVVFPTSCSNKNHKKRIVVWIWVHKPQKHKPHGKHKHHKHKKPSCKAVGKVTGPAGSCVQQTNNATAEQECEAKNNHEWTGSQCTIVQIQVNANCSNVNVGSEGSVGQGGNCQTGGEQTCVGQGNCVVEEEKPCGCEPPPPPCECKPPAPEPPVVEWERIQEIYTDHTRNMCVTVTPASGVSVQFGVKWGERSNGGKGVYNSGTNKFCVTYTAPSEEPPHTCEEAISSKLPPGTKCDIANVVVTSSNGAKTVYAKMEIPILEEDDVVVW